MSNFSKLTSRSARFVLLLFVAAVMQAWLARGAAAANPKSSLEFVPADAHVYVSVSRLGEHVEKIANSNWWAQVQKSEAFGRAMRGFLPAVDPEADADVPPAAMMLATLADLPLYSLAGEMASEEVFFYSDGRAGDMLAMYAEASENMVVAYMGISLMFATGQFDFFDADSGIETKVAEHMLRPVRDNLDKIAVPHLVLGFKIKNPKNAEKVLAQQVDRFREMLGDLAVSAPSDKVLEETVDGANCWIWRFDGATIPWSDALDVPAEMATAFEPIFDHLRKLKGVVTLCVHDGYVLVGVADSPVWIEKLGEGPLLADHDDFAPLKQMADKPITAVVYASREARAVWTFDETDLGNIVKSVKQTLQAWDVSDSIAKDVGRTVDALADELRSHLPRPGSLLTVAQTSAAGLEITTFDRSQPMHLDGSQPLAILDHVGHAPTAFWAGRTKGVEEGYRAVSKTVAGGYGLSEKYVFPAMMPEIQTQVRPFFDRMKPVAKRFDRAMRDLVLPPLAGGDAALVLAARQPDSPWSIDGPHSDAKIAMPLPAVVVAVKDVDQFHAGVKELRGAYNDAVAAYATVEFADPSATLDEPKSREFDEGTIHWHVLPKEWGFDKRIAFNYGLAKNLAVVSLVPLDTRDMLARSTLELPAPLDDRQQPLAAATYIDVPRACEIIGGAMFVVAPIRYEWVEEVHTDEDGGIHIERRRVPVESEGRGAAAKDIRTLAALAKAVPTYTSATKVEASGTVTRGILRIVDLPLAGPKEAEPKP